MTVLVADDDPLARTVLRDALDRGGLTVVGEASTGHEAVELSLELRPDVLLLDLVMPDGDGIDVARRVRAQAPGIAIVVMSTRSDDESALAALRAGASGFLTKDVALGILPRALRAATMGEPAISRQLTRVLIERLRDTPEEGAGLRPVRSRLTPREWEVLDLLCLGKSIGEIAEELVLSSETVRSHVKHILRKTGTRNRAEAIEHASALRRPGQGADKSPGRANPSAPHAPVTLRAIKGSGG